MGWQQRLVSMELARKRRAQRLEAAAAVLTVVVLVCGVIGLAPVHPHPYGDRHSLREVAEIDLAAQEALVDLYRRRHAGRCPESFASLVREGLLVKSPRDPWGSSYLLWCSSDPVSRVEVRSAGRDRVLFTADDVTRGHSPRRRSIEAPP